jgi:hypothetical protein
MPVSIRILISFKVVDKKYCYRKMRELRLDLVYLRSWSVRMAEMTLRLVVWGACVST